MRRLFRSLALGATLAAIAPAVAMAQDSPVLKKGDKALSLGIMTGGDYEGIGGGAAFEVGLLQLVPKIHLSVGGSFGYIRDSESFGSFDYTFTQTPIMAVGNVNFEVPGQPKLGLYAGLSLGIIRVSYSGDFDDVPGLGDRDSDSDSGVGIQGGIRYALTNKASLMGQIGVGDIPLIFAGASIKF
jgi:opacity protein-like surface antigen